MRWLRAAALLVPPDLREEWIAEWRGEWPHAARVLAGRPLALVRFAWGCVIDAWWIRREARVDALESPAVCLAVLAIVWAACTAAAVAGPQRPLASIGFPALMLIAAVVTPSVSVVSAGDPPATGAARWWLFLAAKVGLVLASAYALLHALAGCIGAGAIQALLVACVGAFRWVLADQRCRRPVCLRRTGAPVRVGEPGYALLGWNGSEWMCRRGHGLLLAPEFPADLIATQRWMPLDASWRGLFRR